MFENRLFAYIFPRYIPVGLDVAAQDDRPVDLDIIEDGVRLVTLFFSSLVIKAPPTFPYILENFGEKK